MLIFGRKTIPGRGNCKCKGPEAGRGVCQGRVAERRAEKEQFAWGLVGCGKDFGIYS